MGERDGGKLKSENGLAGGASGSREFLKETGLAVRDDFRPWLQLGLRPAKDMKIVAFVRMAGWERRVEISHGAIEADQLFDPKRA